MKQERSILAGGCFWGMQDLIRKRDGVISTRVGYSGGDVPNATYRQHGTHAEAIEIVFDPDRLSFRELLEFFFQVHDPTTRNRQGNDVGTSYRSAIFTTSDEQRRIAEDTIADVNASGLWPGRVVTEVAPAGPFWEAEPEHQDYLERIPNGYTCHFVRPGWKLPVRDKANAGAGRPLKLTERRIRQSGAIRRSFSEEVRRRRLRLSEVARHSGAARPYPAHGMRRHCASAVGPSGPQPNQVHIESGSNSPWRVETIGTGPVETDDVAGRIRKSCLAPEPRFVAWRLAEEQTFALKPFDRFVQ